MAKEREGGRAADASWYGAPGTLRTEHLASRTRCALVQARRSQAVLQWRIAADVLIDTPIVIGSFDSINFAVASRACDPGFMLYHRLAGSPDTG
jgi:hypothetical protein